MTLNDTDWNSVSATVANKLLMKNNGLPSAGLLPNQSATVDITLKINAGFAGDSLVNFAEISSFKDTVTTDPIEPLDVDSTPDAVSTNDDGGRPSGANDNYVGGNGLATGGAPGDNNLPTDEDDHDPAVVKLEQIMDLALYKVLADGQNYAVRGGDTVNFKITVINQGTIAANNIVVSDYIPSGFTLVSGQGWTAGPIATKTLTIGSGLGAGGLLPKDSVNVFIKLRVNTPVVSGTKLVNLAEISSMTDINGVNRPDIDSDPDNNPTNDTQIVDNEVLGDAKTKGEDEDDHDPAEVVVNPFDLALYKVLAPGQPSLVAPGDTVLFKITVLNQGTIAADNIQVTDYIPSGMTFVTPQAGWNVVSGTEVNTTLVAGTALPVGGLLPGDSVSTTIKLRVSAPYVTGTSLQNWAEISNTTDERGNPQVDIDSDPDNNQANDTYLVDNEVAGDGKNSGDEDDHDQATVTLKEFDLALYKQLAGNQLVAPGDTVTFNITVVNQGTIDAANIQITDYIPTEMTFVNQANWSLSGATATTTLPGVLAIGQSVTVSIMLQVNNPLDANTRITNWAEISDATDKNGNPVVDKDSNPDGTNDDKFLVDDDITGDGKNGGDEDDNDRADIFILPYDLALIKQLAPGQARNVNAGDTVTFRITVFNQGQINAANIVVTDYIPTGMTFVSPQAGWTGAGSTVTTTLPGVLAAGQTTYVDIKLRVNSPLASNTELKNWAEISSSTDDSGKTQVDIDSSPDGNQTNDKFVTDNDPYGDGKMGEDEDDHDPESVFVNPFDLALYKVLAPGQTALVNPGDTVNFRIVVVNQGVVDAANVLITDYIPTQMSFVTQAGWTAVGSNATYTYPGTIKAGDSAFVNIKLRLTSPQPANTTITNWAEITSATDKNNNPQVDIDSNPDNNQTNDKFLSDNEINGNGKSGGDEDDHDKAEIFVQPFDLALIKRLAPGQSTSVAPGQIVNFQVKVVNQGKVPASNIVITDYIPSDMVFVAQPNWTAVGQLATSSPITSVVAPGDSIFLTIQLQVSPTLSPSVTSITNWAEISSATDQYGNPQEDIDSKPDQQNTDTFTTDDYIDGNGKNGGDEDDHDKAVITISKFDLALYKVLAPGQADVVAPGDTVTFKITVINQGVVPADNIQVTDYIPTGMTFVSPQTGWTVVSGTEVNRTLVAGAGLPALGLLAGDSVSTTIKLRVNAPYVSGTSLQNWAEISASTDTSNVVQTDIDSYTDNDQTNDTYLSDNEVNGNGKQQGDEDDHDQAAVTLKEFDLALYKQLVGNQLVAPGDTVSFKITVVNQGTIDAANVQITDYIPAEMTFVNQANWSLSGSIATMTLPGVLAVGQSTSVTIMLQVNDPLAANTRITNWAEISSATDDNGNPVVDKDSNPDQTNDDKFLVDDDINGDGINGGDEDDHDRADLFILPYDLALIKQLAPGQVRNVNAGDTVNFRITVFNQGQINADNIKITDYIPGGMTFVSPQAGWTSVGSTATYTMTGVLAPGQTKYVDIKLRVSSPLAANTALTNWAEITSSTDDSGNFQIDVDSDPDAIQGNDKYITDNDPYGDGKMGEDEDDHDPETVYVNPFDLALYKVLAPGQTAQVNPGDTVNFRIVVINQGVVDAANVLVTDYIPTQMSFRYSSRLDISWD
ncbi:MAG: DUF11 domain-containing protein [Saprospiraceae bacterium]|nr:DUF11 domain-containing protein [Saprospiraceae bacterium]